MGSKKLSNKASLIGGIVGILAVAGVANAGNEALQQVTRPTATPSSVSSPITPASTEVLPAQTTAPTPTPPPEPTPQPASSLSNDNHYTSSAGNTVHSPAYSTDGGVPAGATAECRDGTYSFSQSRRGTCSHHGGVARWL
jgi:hypothetical protein